MYDPWNKSGTPMDHLTAERPALRALVLGAALTAVTTTCITVAPLSADALTVAQVDGDDGRVAEERSRSVLSRPPPDEERAEVAAYLITK
jgi:hypothetical protein